jgi:tetratricopeptide (TPR) repeat protein
VSIRRINQTLIATLIFLLSFSADLQAKSMELTSANTYYNQGDIEQALVWYEKADAKNTQEAQVYQRLVELYSKKNEWDKMNAAFDKIEGCKDKKKKKAKFLEKADHQIKSVWVPMAREHVEARNQAAEHLKAGDNAEAAKSFALAREKAGSALAVIPGSTDFMKNMANTWIEEYNALYADKENEGLNLLTEAGDIYETMLQQNPDSLEYAVVLVQVLYNAKEFDRVSKIVEEQVLCFPKDPDLLSYAGKVYIQKALALEGEAADQMKIKAIGYMDKALEQNPGDPLMVYNLANVYREMESYPEAISNYEKVIEIAGDRQDLLFDVYNSLALFYVQELPEDMLDAGKAAYYFEKALEISPDSVSLKYNLSIALMRTQDPEKMKRGKKMMEELE